MNVLDVLVSSSLRSSGGTVYLPLLPRYAELQILLHPLTERFCHQPAIHGEEYVQQFFRRGIPQEDDTVGILHDERSSYSHGLFPVDP